MSKIIKAGKSLDCGCCGDYFRTWEGYKDQDQDIGYGICNDCQGDAEQDNLKEYERIWKSLLEAVKLDTRAKMEAVVEKDQKMMIAYVNMAMEKGFVKYSIAGR